MVEKNGESTPRAKLTHGVRKLPALGNLGCGLHMERCGSLDWKTTRTNSITWAQKAWGAGLGNLERVLSSWHVRGRP